MRLLTLARRVAAFAWENADRDNLACLACGDTYHIPPDFDPSALCDACAQTYVVLFARLIDKVDARSRRKS